VRKALPSKVKGVFLVVKVQVNLTFVIIVYLAIKRELVFLLQNIAPRLS